MKKIMSYTRKSPGLIDEPTDEESEELDDVPLSDVYMSDPSEELDKEDEAGGEALVKESSEEDVEEASAKGESFELDEVTEMPKESDYPLPSKQPDDKNLALKLRIDDISEELLRSEEERKKSVEEKSQRALKRLRRGKESESTEPSLPPSVLTLIEETPEQTTPRLTVQSPSSKFTISS